MEETTTQAEPGFFAKAWAAITRRNDDDLEEEETVDPQTSSRFANQEPAQRQYRYTVTIRRQIMSLDDMFSAANGFKSGDEQILNLCGTEPQLRQKIVDFLGGVSYAQEGTFEEIGDNIFLIAPHTAYVETVPPTPRTSAGRN